MLKKINLFFLSIFIFTSTSFAQSLIKLGITYTIGKEQSLLGNKKDKNHETTVWSSFGGGLSFDVGYIYLTDDLYGPEAAFTFFIGKPKTINHIVDDQSDRTTIIKEKILYFAPSLFITTNSSNDISPYLSSGLLLNLWENGQMIEIEKTPDNVITEKVWKIDYKIGVGYKSKIGILHNTSDRVKLFGELQYQMIAIAHTQQELISYTVDSENKLETLSVSEKKKIFAPFPYDLNMDDNTLSNPNFDENKPLAVPAYYGNYNHFGASVGTFFNLE